MQYKVEYTVPVRPSITDLPEGATVERVSNLPAKIETGLYRTLTVISSGTDGAAHLTVEGDGSGRVSSHLPNDAARKLIAALQEAIGELPEDTHVGEMYQSGQEIPTVVTKVKDKDGDVWYRRPAPSIDHEAIWRMLENEGKGTNSESYVLSCGPVTVVA